MRRLWLKLRSRNLKTRFQVSGNSYGGLHLTVRRTLMCCRFMGLFPLSGLSHLRSDHLKFTFLSPYVVIYAISMIGQFVMCVLSIFWVFEKNITLDHFSTAMFYVLNFASSLVLAKVGHSWPDTVMKVEQIEAHLPPFSRDVAGICNVTMFFVLVAALGEHLLYIYSMYNQVISHFPDNVVEAFFRHIFPHVFKYTEYSLWKAIIVKLFNIQSTFVWTFNDVLVMVLSTYLTEHFIIHSNLLKTAVHQNHFSAATFRLQYLKIVRLIKTINGKFGIYVMISFGSNLYWICTQLFYILNKGRVTSQSLTTRREQHTAYIEALSFDISDQFYFMYSCLFMMLRTLMVLMLAARINTNSNVPIVTLYGLSSDMYNIEVERYIAQINNIKVALSGLDFFYVTRTMILSLIGTIITYELVLLQFNK